MNKFVEGLERRPTNFVPLTPLSFLARSADIYPRKPAVIHRGETTDYRTFHHRCRRLASALKRRGIGVGDTVAVMLPNVPPMLEAHFGVPMSGAVLNSINTRLDAATVAHILEHGEAGLIIADTQFEDVIREALERMEAPPPLIGFHDGSGQLRDFGEMDYEALLDSGDPDFVWELPEDEWQAIALNYTSGTTGNPKGVVVGHRGAYLAALGGALQFGLDDRSVYLWTLPMFHCNGWSHTWAAVAAGATHVCLREVDPAEIFQAVETHGVTHLCGAPIVLNRLVNAPAEVKRRFAHRVRVATGGAAPPSAIIEAMSAMGFDVVHLYGLTESFGPSSMCVWQTDWDGLDAEATARVMSRQGVRMPSIEALEVVDMDTLEEVPADGQTIGELVLRGNTLMEGYLKNPGATEEAFQGGWYHTGDLAVMHPDGYAEIKDRAKDVIISGGENISSLEVEDVLSHHPAVLAAAVVARPDETWGEAPCAFITLKPGSGDVTEAAIIAYCRDHMAHFKAPRTVVFDELPTTPTGKVQKHVLRERAREMGG